MDLHRRALTRAGAPVRLSGRLVDVLGHLASHPGAVISKEALLDRFWPGLHVSDNTLDRAMTRIRQALADEASRPRFIQTVTGLGYRFIGVIDAADTPGGLEAFVDWTKGRLSLEALNAGQLDDAAAAFEHVLAANRSYGPAHTAVANACFLQFEVTRPENTPDRALLLRAIDHARQACDLAPASGEAWATLALALTAAGQAAQARAAARQATVIEPASWRHQFRLAFACWGEERLHAADRTLALMPDFAPARFIAAMVFVARQAFAVAEELAVKGAARQSTDACSDVPFPAFGLHWLLGLVQLRNGLLAQALDAFQREVNEGRRASIYYREFRLNALTAAGYAHLRANRPGAAIDAFRHALDVVPGHGRALLGLQRAFAHSGRASEAESLAGRVQESIGELTSGGRVGEAAALTAGVEAARGDLASACAVLERLLTNALPGQTGWMIPIDPALAPLHDHPSFERVLALLAGRAS